MYLQAVGAIDQRADLRLTDGDATLRFDGSDECEQFTINRNSQAHTGTTIATSIVLGAAVDPNQGGEDGVW